MSPKKLVLGSDEFAQCVLPYSDSFPGDEDQYRIVIPVSFGNLMTTAILDTGTPWCILNPEEADALNLDYQNMGEVMTRPLKIRGLAYGGWICRIPATLKAIEGTAVTFEATVFIPQLDGHPWNYPNFVGLSGFLDRIRFAIDPELSLFYFGALDGS